MFIQLMNALFEMARKQYLEPKIQHEVIYQFADDYCESTKALDDMGPILYKKLNTIGNYIEERVHGQSISTYGTSFTLKKSISKQEDIRWLQVAIAYSRILVDAETKKSGIRDKTKFTLSNCYAVKYWIPMRSDTVIPIMLEDETTNSYIVKTEGDMLDTYQISLNLEELK
jgi:hypothetical protein